VGRQLFFLPVFAGFLLLAFGCWLLVVGRVLLVSCARSPLMVEELSREIGALTLEDSTRANGTGRLLLPGGVDKYTPFSGRGNSEQPFGCTSWKGDCSHSSDMCAGQSC